MLGYDVRVNSYCEIENSIVFNHVNIGRYSRIRNAIIDRHVVSLSARKSATIRLPTASVTMLPKAVSLYVVRDESMLEEPE